jgi:hypothetical protein
MYNLLESIAPLNMTIMNTLETTQPPIFDQAAEQQTVNGLNADFAQKWESIVAQLRDDTAPEPVQGRHRLERMQTEDGLQGGREWLGQVAINTSDRPNAIERARAAVSTASQSVLDRVNRRILTTYARMGERSGDPTIWSEAAFGIVALGMVVTRTHAVELFHGVESLVADSTNSALPEVHSAGLVKNAAYVTEHAETAVAQAQDPNTDNGDGGDENPVSRFFNWVGSLGGQSSSRSPEGVQDSGTGESPAAATPTPAPAPTPLPSSDRPGLVPVETTPTTGGPSWGTFDPVTWAKDTWNGIFSGSGSSQSGTRSPEGVTDDGTGSTQPATTVPASAPVSVPVETTPPAAPASPDSESGWDKAWNAVGDWFSSLGGSNNTRSPEGVPDAGTGESTQPAPTTAPVPAPTSAPRTPDALPAPAPTTAPAPAPAPHTPAPAQPAPGHDGLAFNIEPKDGDYPWDVMQRNGVANRDIMPELERAGHDYEAATGEKVELHGSGTHRWIEVDGDSKPSVVWSKLVGFLRRNS